MIQFNGKNYTDMCVYQMSDTFSQRMTLQQWRDKIASIYPKDKTLFHLALQKMYCTALTIKDDNDCHKVMDTIYSNIDKELLEKLDRECPEQSPSNSWYVYVTLAHPHVKRLHHIKKLLTITRLNSNAVSQLAKRMDNDVIMRDVGRFMAHCDIIELSDGDITRYLLGIFAENEYLRDMYRGKYGSIVDIVAV